jgi:hypothetical protein
MTKLKILRQYTYRQWLGTILLVLTIFAGPATLCTILAYHGLAEGEGLVALGFAVFFWALATLPMYFGLQWLFARNRIALTERGIILPRNRWTNRELYVEFADITDLHFQKVSVGGESDVAFAYFLCSQGEFAIARQKMWKKDFDELGIYLLATLKRRQDFLHYLDLQAANRKWQG